MTRKKPYIRCTRKAKRIRDMMSAETGMGKEEAMEKAMQYVMRNKREFYKSVKGRRDAKKRTKETAEEFVDGFFDRGWMR